ncbi:MAG: adenosylcobalamin-dependent ribonucleoside-diphosphate reductase [Acidimicrobiia bacterium]|nr:adenosylcobalamin-dependent ribonucleoside-diphosphate reductase [Acidimicrobiia bacterium]
MIDIPLTANAVAVLERRYLLRDGEGRPTESAVDMFRRVAANIAAAETLWNGSPELWEDRFFEVMARLDFLPNSPTMMNAGRELQQLAACFVLPIEDSLDSIFDTLKHTAKIHQSGGGTGFSFSRLRARGDMVKTTRGVSSGPVSFLEVYDSATEHIKQGSFRRGANMGILDVTHPDITRFIDAKRDGGITNFNLSVAVTVDWMNRAEHGEDYELIDPRSGEAVGTENAGRIFDAMVDSAWATGDPGVVFLDRMNRPRTNPTPALGRIEATNPCGEQPLLPYEACVLGSVNLAHFVTHDDHPDVDWRRLGETVRLAVRFLDNAVEQSRYPLPQIEELHKRGNRKIGLGVMGWADMLIKLALPYDGETAVELADRVMGFVSSEADAAAEALASERGSFGNWNESIYGPAGPARQNRPMRNATRTTIAPTGTISIIAGCSSGIEPLFALSYYRKVMEGTTLLEVNPDFARTAAASGTWSDELAAAVAERGGVRGMDGVPDYMQSVFATAHDVAPEWHVRHQAAFQHRVDNAVSKTINLPRDATRDDVGQIYLLARDLGCTGITVYRDGSKRWQVLNRGRPTGTDIGTMEGSPPAVGEDEHPVPPLRGQSVFEICPMCGAAAFEFAEACGKCHSCGHSTC